MKAMFILTVFEILLFEGRLVLGPAQWGTEVKGLVFSHYCFTLS